MSQAVAIELGDIQKTLILPLWGRAFESRKAKPLLVDKTALEIIDKTDYDYAALARNLNPLTQMAWIMRTLCVDEVIGQFLAKYPHGTIVNIGCGLDTSFDRNDNGSLLWYDLDMPDAIALRSKFIHESTRRKFLATSFLERDWMKQIVVSENVLFIAAGVLYYFEEAQVKEFLIRLADTFPRSEILFDVCSPYGLRVANKMVIQRSGLGEKSFLKWSVPNPGVITAWDHRIRLVSIYWYFGQRARGLGLKLRLLGMLSDWLKVQYMILLRFED